MIILPNGTIPMFLNGLSPSGEVDPAYPSQIKNFDVYYDHAPAVGIHILDSEQVAQAEPEASMVAFFAEGGDANLSFVASQSDNETNPISVQVLHEE